VPQDGIDYLNRIDGIHNVIFVSVKKAR